MRWVRARFVYTGVLLTLVGLFAGFPVYMLTLTMATWRFFKRQHRRQYDSWSFCGKRLSVPVDLVYDGSQTYVIELDNGRIVQLDKSLVAGIANITSSLQYRVR